mgnify:CR=1 FL=1
MDKAIHRRFGGMLPVVVDCETGGCNPSKDALLEVACVSLKYDDQHKLVQDQTYHYHVEPFEGARISQESLEVTQIQPYHPFRFAVAEERMLKELSEALQALVAQQRCRRAVLVGHNAQFDLSFMQAAYARCAMVSKSPFHRFTTFDTATIGGICYRETVLAKAMRRARVTFDVNEAHSALYDAKKTAELFCKVINRLDDVY